jgi:hypothetical protein
MSPVIDNFSKMDTLLTNASNFSQNYLLTLPRLEANWAAMVGRTQGNKKAVDWARLSQRLGSGPSQVRE